MTTEDEIFNGEMELAYSRRAGEEIYWSGYATGLMRARFGRVAVRRGFGFEWRCVGG